MTLKSDSQTYSTGRHPLSLTIGDFNRDFYPDLAVTNYEDHSIGIILANGDGTFQTQQIFWTGDLSYPWGIVNADFNNDTLLDLGKYLKSLCYILSLFKIYFENSKL